MLPPEAVSRVLSFEPVIRPNTFLDPAWYVHAFRLQLLTGLRNGELLDLRWSDIKDGYLTVHGSLNGFGEHTRGKNDNARRTIYLPELARQELAQQRVLVSRFYGPHALVFPAKDGSQTTQDRYRSVWRKFCDAAGVPYLSPYESFRHTFCSFNKEMPEAYKKLLMGHSASMDTEGVYGHEMAGDLVAAASYVDRAVSSILASH